MVKNHPIFEFYGVSIPKDDIDSMIEKETSISLSEDEVYAKIKDIITENVDINEAFREIDVENPLTIGKKVKTPKEAGEYWANTEEYANAAYMVNEGGPGSGNLRFKVKFPHGDINWLPTIRQQLLYPEEHEINFDMNKASIESVKVKKHPNSDCLYNDDDEWIEIRDKDDEKYIDPQLLKRVKEFDECNNFDSEEVIYTKKDEE